MMRGKIYPKSESFIGGDGTSQETNPMQMKQIGNKADIMKAAGDVAGVIISSLGSLQDAKLRKEYQQKLSQLDRQEQAALAKELAKARTDADRRKVFADLLSSSTKTRIESGMPKNYQIGLYVFGGVIILGATIYILNKSLK